MSTIPAKRKRKRIRSGLYAAKRALNVGLLAEERAALVAHVGGTPSATEAGAIAGILQLDLVLGSGVAALAEFGPINRRSRNFRRLALDVARLAAMRHRMLADLGWKASARPVASLAAYLAAPKPGPATIDTEAKPQAVPLTSSATAPATGAK